MSRKGYALAPPRGIELNLREIWRQRELLWFLMWRDVKVRYKQTLIGAAWAALQPLFQMVIFLIIFGHFAGLPSDGLPLPVFYLSGLILWIYFANVLGNATQSVVENREMLTKVYFPRLYLVLSPILSGLLDFAIALALFLVILVAFAPPFTPALLLAPLFVLLAVASAAGAGLWLAGLNALYRDVRHVVPFLVQVWMFASPVIYPSLIVPQKWRWLYSLNPMAGAIDGLRWSLTGVETPPVTILASLAVALLLLLSGLVFFQKVESTLADVI